MTTAKQNEEKIMIMLHHVSKNITIKKIRVNDKNTGKEYDTILITSDFREDRGSSSITLLSDGDITAKLEGFGEDKDNG